MWYRDVMKELQNQNLFQSADHRTRMDEMIGCYCKDSFFKPGLVKCMYLSCWDEEHFIVMLDMLNQLKFCKNLGLSDMSENGEFLAEEAKEHVYDAYIFRLSCSFLNGTVFDMETLPDNIEPEGRYIITEALKASDVIDRITQ